MLLGIKTDLYNIYNNIINNKSDMYNNNCELMYIFYSDITYKILQRDNYRSRTNKIESKDKNEK